MRPITVTAGPYTAASANNLATSQTPTSGTALTLTALAAKLDTPRRVLLTFGNEGSARTLVLTGTTWGGSPISETITVASGAGGMAISVLDYASVTSALPLGGGWTAAVTLGTSATTTSGSSAWVRLDDYGFGPTSIVVDITGTITYTVEAATQDPNAVAPLPVIAPAVMVWTPDSTLTSKAANGQVQWTAPPLWVRLTANSYTGTGNAFMVVHQMGAKGG